MLDIKAEKSDGVMRIALEGKVNSVTARDLSQKMESELDGAHRIELDFAKLDYNGQNNHGHVVKLGSSL